MRPKHAGYWLHPEVIKGVASQWLRMAIAVSRSAVVHRITDGARDVREVSTRHGLTIEMFGFRFAIYAENKGKRFDLGPSETELALAVGVAKAEEQ